MYLYYRGGTEEHKRGLNVHFQTFNESQGWHVCNSIHRLELLEMHNGSAVTLFGIIFVDDIE